MRNYYIVLNILHYIMMGGLVYLAEMGYGGWQIAISCILWLLGILFLFAPVFLLYKKETALGIWSMAEIFLRAVNITLVFGVLEGSENIAFSLAVIFMVICSGMNIIVDVVLLRRFERSSITVSGIFEKVQPKTLQKSPHFYRYYYYIIGCFALFRDNGQDRYDQIIPSTMTLAILFVFVYHKLKWRYALWRRIKGPVLLCLASYLLGVGMCWFHIIYEVKACTCVICVMLMVRIIDRLEVIREERCL